MTRTKTQPAPIEPLRATNAEPIGLQPGESVAATGAAPTNRALVVDESAATAGEDRRTAGETCALLLATAGGRASEPATVRDDAGSDRSAPGTNGIDNGGQGQHQNMSYQGAEGEEVLQERAAK
jgi:hypothetical protein